MRDELIGITGPGLSASFGYDAFGRRSTKTLNGQTTHYLADGINPLQEQASAGQNWTALTMTGLGVDEIIARGDASGTYYFLPDGLGSTVALMDGAGAIHTEYTYAPFGETTRTGTVSTNPFQFTGRENDNTGLYYYRARYYHPVLQRFISEDPIGFAGGDVNLYAYVGNAPINFVDPFGTNVAAAIEQAIAKGLGIAITGATTTVTVVGAFITAAIWDLTHAAPAGGPDAVFVPTSAKPFDPDQQALQDLVRDATLGGRKPLTCPDAETVLDWADEYGYPGVRATPGDVADPSNWYGHPNRSPHIHLPGTVPSGHVPVAPGVKPRP